MRRMKHQRLRVVDCAVAAADTLACILSDTYNHIYHRYIHRNAVGEAEVRVGVGRLEQQHVHHAHASAVPQEGELCCGCVKVSE